MKRAAFIGSVLSVVAFACADDIVVQPGDGTISAGAGDAREGDVLVLGEGEYRDAVILPKGVSIRGAGADHTTLIAINQTGIRCAEGENAIVGITIRATDQTTRGVTSEGPVRVERVRFEKVQEAVSISVAPLSDVVFCEFEDCGVGIRAEGESSPTVWGCVFQGGDIGVVGVHGAPYIRHCAFVGSGIGIRIATEMGPIIRNSAFIECSTGIAIRPGHRDFLSDEVSIRNNIFHGCDFAVVSKDELRAIVSHAVMFPGPPRLVCAQDGRPLWNPLWRTVVVADTGPELDGSDLSFTDWDSLDGMGLRLCSEPEEARGTIGPDPALRPLGVAAPEHDVPKTRYIGPLHELNAPFERYEVTRYWGARASKTTRTEHDGVQVDECTVEVDGEARQVYFGVDRYLGESKIQFRLR